MPEESFLEPNSNINHTTIGLDFAGLGETDKEIKVLIINGDDIGSIASIIHHACSHDNKPLIIFPKNQPRDELSADVLLKKQPIPIMPMAPLREVFIEKDNKPWYSMYQNKRGKKRK